jgi:hypothetical protein
LFDDVDKLFLEMVLRRADEMILRRFRVLSGALD